MKKFIWIVLVLVLSTSLALAQVACLPLDDTLLDALTSCDDSDIGTLCYGAGDITVGSSADELTFEETNLGSIHDIQTENIEDTLAIAIMRLNREGIALRVIVYGDTGIENTAPQNTISVYALRGVNLRETPSVEARVIGSLVQGTDYTAVGRLADNTWIRVLLDDGRIGWASAQYFSTRDGFTELDAVTPTTPPYLPMQSLTMTTGDCSGVILIAPETDEESIIFGINGAQIQVSGLAHIHTEDNQLIVEALAGEAIVNTFGFEISLSTGELTTIALNDTNTLIGIATDAEAVEEAILAEDLIEALLGDEN